MNLWKRVTAAVVLSAMALGLAACGSNSAPQNGSAEQGYGDTSGDLKKVTFVLDWTPNTNHTGLYVALQNGYFEDAGLDVDVVQPPDDGAEVLVGSGKADFGVSFQDTMASALIGDNALPITAVAAVIQHNTSGIISRAGEGMDRPKGLEGKKYATWEMDIEKAMMKNVVETDGGDFSKVELIPSTVTDEVSALQSKSVDAIWVYYAWAGIATKVAGLDTDYFAFSDINPVFDYYTPVIIANNDFLKNDPETAKAFLAALAKGYEYAEQNPEEAADILLEQCPELKSNRELVVESQKYLADKYTADASQWGIFDAERWNAFYNWLNENDLVSADIPENTGFSNDYLPQS